MYSIIIHPSFRRKQVARVSVANNLTGTHMYSNLVLTASHILAGAGAALPQDEEPSYFVRLHV